MRTWERHYEEQEADAMGAALLQCLGKLYGCEPTEDAIKHRVYKETECGAWIVFFPGGRLGVTVGSIVEGSDAEVEGIFVPYDPADDDEDLPEDQNPFVIAYRAAIEAVEQQADMLWHEANCEDEDEPE